MQIISVYGEKMFFLINRKCFYNFWIVPILLTSYSNDFLIRPSILRHLSVGLSAGLSVFLSVSVSDKCFFSPRMRWKGLVSAAPFSPLHPQPWVSHNTGPGWEALRWSPFSLSTVLAEKPMLRYNHAVYGSFEAEFRGSITAEIK